MGPALGTQIVGDAFERAGAKVVHVNTQDRRTVFNTGVLDLRNVALALLHSALFAWRAARYRTGLVYVPISQGRWGYARDAVLLSIARLLRRPAVVHLRGSNLQQFYRSSPAFERAIIRKTLSWSRRAIVLTPGLQGVFEGLVPLERVRVLENAIPDPWPEGIDRLRHERRMRAESEHASLRVLYVANDFATKGASTLVKALAEPGLEQAVVRMVGAPPEEVAQGTERLAVELGIAERVDLLGGIEGQEKWRAYEWADVFAYPTENDGQPLVILEAMAAGLPIVASTYGGIPDTVAETALLVAPGDHAGLADALRSLIERPALRDELSHAARGRFVTRYTLESFQQRFEAVFGDLLEAER